MTEDTTDRRLRILEVGQRLLTDQQAEITVAMHGLDARMQRAMADGLREVLNDEELMDGVLERLRARLVRGAAERTGRWLWDSIRAVLNKWLLIVLIVLVVGQYAGLAPAKTVLGWLTGGKQP